MVKSVRSREAHHRIARQGKSSGGGPRWFGYTRIYANPEEPSKRKLFADPSRRPHVVGRKQHLLSGIARCGKCDGPLYPYVASKGKSATYRCVTGPAGKGCGGVSVLAGILDEYVTGAVLDALESPRIQEAVRAGGDTSAPRRAELLEEIRKAQEKRAEARRDWAEDSIDKADWLDIKQRTEARIGKAQKEYDKLAGSATVFGDIPASDMVRDAWEGWNADRRRVAVRAILDRVIVSPHAGRKGGPNLTPELKLQFVRDRTEFDWRF